MRDCVQSNSHDNLKKARWGLTRHLVQRCERRDSQFPSGFFLALCWFGIVSKE